MKLLNYTTKYFALVLIFIISIWAIIFYWSMLDEIYDSLDDGLENQKLIVIYQATKNPQILKKNTFGDGYYVINEIQFEKYENFRDRYIDTLMYTEYEDDLEPMRMLSTVFRQGDKYYNLKLITSMVEEDDLIKNLLAFLLILYVILVSTILYLNNKILKRIWKPFYNLLNEIKSFKLNKPQQINFMQSKVDEFTLLNKNIKRLLQNNIDVYNSQKVFIENAAHELQTPLAVSINKLELIPDYDKLTEEQREYIESVLKNLERLKKLNKSLLLISKIENKQFSDEVTIEVNNLVKEIVNELSEIAEYRQVNIIIRENASSSFTMNKDLARILISNLITNAIVHANKRTEVEIDIEMNKITFRNIGATEALDSTKIFRRFYKASRSNRSTGLGLSISKAISELYDFSINYYFDKAHIFTLEFK